MRGCFLSIYSQGLNQCINKRSYKTAPTSNFDNEMFPVVKYMFQVTARCCILLK